MPDPLADFALDYFAPQVAQFAAMMAVSMGGLDAVVFTGASGKMQDRFAMRSSPGWSSCGRSEP